ncbi:MAG: hypothetical protein ACTSX4_05985, partial [Candidatus Helarchaeota archaeon]
NRSNREFFYEILNYAFFEECLSFKNHIEARDFVIKTEKMEDAINKKDEKFNTIMKEFQEINIFEFYQQIENINHVAHLLDKFGKSILTLLEKLFDQNYITIIDEDHRYLLIAIEITHDFIIILTDLLGQKKFFPILKNILNSMNNPEISRRISFENDEITVKRDATLLEVGSWDEIQKAGKAWIDFSSRLIEIFYPKLKKKLLPNFYSLLTEHYLGFIHEKDMELLEPLLSKLEEKQK